MSRDTSRDYAEAAAYRHEPAAGAAPPVVLLHGLGGDSGQLWELLGPRRPRIAPDQRAHGDTRYTGPDAELRFATLARDLELLLARIGCGRALLVGVSMGAAVALTFALRRPELVCGLVLIRPAWLVDPEPPNLRPVQRIGALLRSHGPVDGAAAFRAEPAFRDTASVSPAGAQSLLRQFSADDAVGRAGRLIELPRSTPVTRLSDLAQLSLPTLVIGAVRDPQHPMSMAVRTAAALPRAQLAELPSRDDDADGQRRALERLTWDFVSRLPAPPDP